MLDPVIWLIYLVMLFITFFQVLLFLERGRVKYPVNWRDEWPSVSLIVPAYNEEDTIEMTIESILDVEYPEEKLEVVVVNDGSQDNTEKKVQPYVDRGEVEMISQENQGKGAALNTGIENTSGEILGCVDADSYLRDDSLKNIISELDEDTAAVTSAMKAYKPNTLIQKVQRIEYITAIFLRYLVGLVDSIFVAPGPLSIYRRSDIEEIGKFDEESLVEDQEICYRLQKHHKKVGHSRKGEALTVTPPSLKAFYYQRYRWYRGTIETLIRYKSMLFDREYGDFGLFMMPAIVAQGFLSITALVLTIYLTAKPLLTFFRDFLAVGFSVFDLSSLTVSKIMNAVYWNILSQEVLLLIMLGSVFLLSLLTAYLACKHTEEKLFEYGYLAPFLYLVAYVFIVGFVWLKASVDIAMDRGREW